MDLSNIEFVVSSEEEGQKLLDVLEAMGDYVCENLRSGYCTFSKYPYVSKDGHLWTGWQTARSGKMQIKCEEFLNE